MPRPSLTWDTLVAHKRHESNAGNDHMRARADQNRWHPFLDRFDCNDSKSAFCDSEDRNCCKAWHLNRITQKDITHTFTRWIGSNFGSSFAPALAPQWCLCCLTLVICASNDFVRFGWHYFTDDHLVFFFGVQSQCLENQGFDMTIANAAHFPCYESCRTMMNDTWLSVKTKFFILASKFLNGTINRLSCLCICCSCTNVLQQIDIVCLYGSINGFLVFANICKISMYFSYPSAT